MSLTTLEPNLNEIVKEYLDSCGYIKTSTLFSDECLEFGKPQPTSPSIVQRRSVLLKTQRDMMKHFQNGERVQFFELWNEHLPPKIRNEDTIALKLEFYLQVHFFAYPFKNSPEDSHACDNASRVLREYLETRGAPLSQNIEFLPFYALPFTPNPRNHPSFRDLFLGHWVNDLDLRVSRYLQLVLDPGEGGSDHKPQLFDLYTGSAVRDRAMLRMVKEEAMDADRRCKVYRRHANRLQADYHTLIGITAELVDTLQMMVSGRHVNPGHLDGLCRRLAVAQSLDYHYSALDLETATATERAGPLDDDFRGVLVRTERWSGGGGGDGRQSHMATQYEPAVEEGPKLEKTTDKGGPLNFEKILRDLKKSTDRRKCFLLQALRWRLTKTSPSEAGANLTSFIHFDLLGCRGAGVSRDIFQEFISSQDVQLRQCSARLINTIASFNRGRSYLIANSALTITMIERLRHEPGESHMRNNLIGALQKLSLRRPMQTLMIQGGLIAWLETLLVNQGRGLSNYSLEYSVALLMNLCLRTLGI